MITPKNLVARTRIYADYEREGDRLYQQEKFCQAGLQFQEKQKQIMPSLRSTNRTTLKLRVSRK